MTMPSGLLDPTGGYDRIRAAQFATRQPPPLVPPQMQAAPQRMTIWDRLRGGAEKLFGIPQQGLLSPNDRNYALRQGLLSAGSAVANADPSQGILHALTQVAPGGRQGAVSAVQQQDAYRQRLAGLDRAQRLASIQQQFIGKSPADYAKALALGGFFDEAKTVSEAVKAIAPDLGDQIKVADASRREAFRKANPQYVNYSDSAVDKVMEQAVKPEGLTPDQKIQAAGTVRAQFNQEPAIQRASVVGTYFPQIEEGAKNPTPAGDLGIVYGIMKLFDPRSSVQQGEQANAQNAGGVPQWLRSKWNELVGGGKLSQGLRDDYVNTARKIIKTHQGEVGQLVKRYSGIAKRNGLDPQDIVYNPIEGVGLTPSVPGAVTAQPAAGAKVNVGKRGDVLDPELPN